MDFPNQLALPVGKVLRKVLIFFSKQECCTIIKYKLKNKLEFITWRFSYENQIWRSYLWETIDSEEVTPSLVQAIRMKALSREGNLDMDTIFEIMREEKPNQKEQVKIPMDRFSKYFPRGTPQKRIESVIFVALELYYKEQERQRRRSTDRDAR